MKIGYYLTDEETVAEVRYLQESCSGRLAGAEKAAEHFAATTGMSLDGNRVSLVDGYLEGCQRGEPAGV